MLNLFRLLLLLVFLSACQDQQHYPLAKNFTLTDGHQQTFQLSDYQGKPLVIIFWATWCPYCAKVMPSLEKYYQKYNRQGLEIIAINIMEDGDPITHMKNKGFHYRLGLDGDQVAEDWSVTGTPTLFFINRRGEIIASNQISDPKSEVVKQLINELLKN